MKTLTDVEFHAACVEQANSFAETVVVCPVCKTPQSGQDFLDAGLRKDEAKSVMGYDCIGRYTGAEGPRKKPDGKPCNWTLGHLPQRHKLEIVTPDGRTHPHFELASFEAAKAYREKRAAVAQKGGQ